MSASPRAQLKQRQRQLVQDAATRLADDPDADISSDMSQINAINDVLRSFPPSTWQRLRRPLAVALACIILAGTAWMVTIDQIGLRSPLSLSAQASSVSVVTRRDWSSSAAVSLTGSTRPELRIEEASLTFSAPARAFNQLDESMALRAKSGRMELSSLHAPLGTSMTFEKSGGDRLMLFLRGAGASGHIQLRDDIHLDWRSTADERFSKSFNVSVPERLSFKVATDRIVPTRLTFWPKDQTTFHDIPASRIHFNQERTLDDAAGSTLVSTLLDGNLHLLDVDQKTPLKRGEQIILEGVEGWIRQLQIGEQIVVDFEGSAKSLALGPKEERRTLTPSLLAYAFHNQRLDFLFVAVSFVWGLLWSLARLIDV